MATQVLVPPLGQTVDVVRLVAWYKGEGEKVAQGEALFAIETDKATLDVESPASGVLRQVGAQPGEDVKVLSAIALIVAADEAVESAQAAPHHSAEPSGLPAPAGRQAPSPETRFFGLREDLVSHRQGGDKRQRTFISPRARRLAEEHHVPLAALQPSGPEGAIIERDVRSYLEAQTGPAALVRTEPSITPVARRMAEEAGLDWRALSGSGPGGRIGREDVAQVLESETKFFALRENLVSPAEMNEVRETIPLRSVRAVIAERMLRSATDTAHVTLAAEADATALVDLRRQFVEDGLDVSYNDLLLYVLGRALREHPHLNASLQGDEIKLWRRVHIGLAVDTERGLLVPVVRDVDGKGLLQLAGETRELAERARSGLCPPEELRGGTFTLTNLGMYGIDMFTPIINMPECAILGVGRIKTQPVMNGDQVVGRQTVWLSLTFDHRLVDGGPAARFLQRVVQFIERPHLLIT
jgi:pyruvate dehydrogenase E2 component (dihydrolipoamide acetyltransferase)